MTWFIFIGDMLVMAFMTALVIAVSLRDTRERIEDTARIPLQDEQQHG